MILTTFRTSIRTTDLFPIMGIIILNIISMGLPDLSTFLLKSKVNSQSDVQND